jgi:sugar lactone lactonase YvrE
MVEPLTYRNIHMRFGLLLSMLVCCSPAWAADDIDALAGKLNAAHKAHDYAAMEAAADEILAELPGYPLVIYLQAEARAGLHDTSGTLKALTQLADMGLYFDIDKTAEFAALHEDSGFKALQTRFTANQVQTGRVTPAFSLSEPDFIPEGLDHDPKSGDFFVASVHLRKILRVHAGKASVFATQDTGLWSVMGLRVDAAHGALWAVSSALPQMQGYDASLDGKSALFRFDLKSGALQDKYAAADGAAHQFNDLCVAPDSKVYVADSSGGVYVLAPGQKILTALVATHDLRSSQGLALSADGRHLYVADYALGLYAYDLSDGHLTRLTTPGNITGFGIDGLYRYGHSLLATQNGVTPQRVIRFDLDGSGLNVVSARILDANDPRVPEPTLFTVVGDTLYLVANSQWSRFDEHNQLPPVAQLQAPAIVQLPLR